MQEGLQLHVHLKMKLVVMVLEFVMFSVEFMLIKLLELVKMLVVIEMEQNLLFPK